ncbi:MAG: hypothetical protein FWB74_05025 [Defluviitaleaceae bacterium]|nr:hypothetical protein [Defluviitaleaceae bacterium]
MKRLLAAKTLFMALLIFTACGGNGYEYEYLGELPPSTGRIFMFGENHGCPRTMQRQLEIWGSFYHDHGMRHLFIEMPYFTGQLLNRWMQAEDDDIIYQLFEDWHGSYAGMQYTLEFYKAVKHYFPETVFHGSDVGHQSYSSGLRYLQLLRDEGLQYTDSYNFALENIVQFHRLMLTGCHSVRAYYKPQNFARHFDRLQGENVMAIHEMRHVAIGYDFMGLGVPSMGTTLHERYGDQLEVTLMTIPFLMMPLREFIP